MESNGPHVEILMASYNGELYISTQIDSIINQSYSNWSLVIHDDGSTDSTIEIIDGYVSQFPSRIFFLNDSVKCGGAKYNFSHLMAHATADYVMFADQDDVWLPSKVKDSLSRLLEHEAILSKQVPMAVFTDLAVVDEALNIIAPSFWTFQNLKPQKLSGCIENLAVRNCITGCTLLMNRSALTVSLPVLPVAVMHDWWCGLRILQAKGKLIPLSLSTILYRQHSGNVVGAKQWSMAVVFQKILRLSHYRKDFIANYRMAKYFLPRFDIFSFCIRKIMMVAR